MNRAIWMIGLLGALAALGLVGGDPAVDPSAIGGWGTDHLGRPIFWLVARGCTVGVLPCLVAAPIFAVSCAISAASAWVGGPIRAAWASWIGAVAAIPALVWVVLVVAALGRNPWALGLACALTFHPRIDALLVDAIAGWRRDEGVLAELAHGTPRGLVLLRTLVWWRCGDGLIRGSLRLVGFVFVIEATLAYLGMPVTGLASLGVTIAGDWGRPIGWASWVAPIAVLWAVGWTTVESP